MIDTETLSEWIQKVQGQYVNEDWNPENQGFGAQCWDLAANWSKRLGLPVINTGYPGRWIGWAGNMVAAYPQTPEIAAAYELIGPDQTGLPGDIAVWGDSFWYYPATHVAVLVADKGNQLQCMSQNSTPSRAGNPYPGQSSGPTTIQSLPRQGLIGFLRPRIGISPAGTITPIQSEEDELSDDQVERIIRELTIVGEQQHKATRETVTGTGDEVKDLVKDRAVFVAQENVKVGEGIGRVTQQLILDTRTPEAIVAQIPEDLAQKVIDALIAKLGGK